MFFVAEAHQDPSQRKVSRLYGIWKVIRSRETQDLFARLQACLPGKLIINEIILESGLVLK